METVHTVRFHLWWVFPFRQLNAKLFPDQHFLGVAITSWPVIHLADARKLGNFLRNTTTLVGFECALVLDALALFGIDNNKYPFRCDDNPFPNFLC